MSQTPNRTRALAPACAVALIMSLAPATANAQVQPNASPSPIPGSVKPSSPQTNALTNNPNGPDWLKKFDRQLKDMPMLNPTVPK